MSTSSSPTEPSSISLASGSRSDGVYETRSRSSALRCVDQLATVQQISLPPAGSAYADPPVPTTTNALGEVTSKPRPQSETHIELVVLCPDGTIAKSVYLGYFLPSVMLLADSSENPEVTKQKLQKQIDAKVGSSVFPEPGAKVFSDTSSMSDLVHTRVPITPPYLSPLQIVSGRIIDFEGQTYSVLKVKSEVGLSYLLCTKVSLYTPSSVLDEHLLTELSLFSPMDLSAVRSATPRRGMSRHALYIMWGIETKDNDYGQGGHQLIFDRHGYEALVYVSADDIVTDIQTFPKE
jgi:hypothetical protein